MAPNDDVDLTICLTGPESTGKTTLALALGERLEARVVPEVARAYLAHRDGYDADDVLEIARLQLAAEARARAAHRGLLICDTDLLVLQIWWREKYGELPALLSKLPRETAPRVYLLLAPDLPWMPDPLRENPVDRDRLYGLHLAALQGDNWPHRVVTGVGDARTECAVAQIASLTMQAGVAR
jgi:nicotinamide riboside kinase